MDASQAGAPLQGNIVGKYLLRKRPGTLGTPDTDEEGGEAQLATAAPHGAGINQEAQVISLLVLNTRPRAIFSPAALETGSGLAYRGVECLKCQGKREESDFQRLMLTAWVSCRASTKSRLLCCKSRVRRLLEYA